MARAAAYQVASIRLLLKDSFHPVQRNCILIGFAISGLNKFI